MKKVVQPEDYLAEEYELDQHGKLLDRFIKYEGVCGSAIENYDDWIINTLPKQIESKILTTKDDIIWFEGAEADLPEKNPIETIRIGGSYCANVWTRMYAIKKSLIVSGLEKKISEKCMLDEDLLQKSLMLEKSKRRFIDRVFIGKIPVMVGSILCCTKGKSREQMLKMGMDSKDPGGWFVIKGMEKIILWQEKLRTNLPLVFIGEKIINKTGSQNEQIRLQARMTVNSINGPSVIYLKEVVNIREGYSREIEMSLKCMDKNEKDELNSIGIFQIYRMLGRSDPQAILNEITMLSKPIDRKRVWMVLQPSILRLLTIPDDYVFLAKKMGKLVNSEILEETVRNEILNNVKKELFPQIPANDIQTKLQMLGIMINRLAEVMAGIRPTDDRDSWSNKRLESSRAMQEAFRQLWDKFIEETKKEIKEKNLEPQLITKLLPTKIISDEFVAHFDSCNWGVKSPYTTYKENITDFLKRDNLLCMFAHLRRINAATSRKAKQASIRMVQMSQLGFVDPGDTPEGENTGIVKYCSMTTGMSLDRNPEPIIARLKNMLSNTITDEHNTYCILNGIILGWCNGEKTREYCIKMRRSLIFPKIFPLF
jgi:DNA-directed RNA polymerase beta subunit